MIRPYLPLDAEQQETFKKLFHEGVVSTKIFEAIGQPYDNVYECQQRFRRYTKKLKLPRRPIPHKHVSEEEKIKRRKQRIVRIQEAIEYYQGNISRLKAELASINLQQIP